MLKAGNRTSESSWTLPASPLARTLLGKSWGHTGSLLLFSPTGALARGTCLWTCGWHQCDPTAQCGVPFPACADDPLWERLSEAAIKVKMRPPFSVNRTPLGPGALGAGRPLELSKVWGFILECWPGAPQVSSWGHWFMARPWRGWHCEGHWGRCGGLERTSQGRFCLLGSSTEPVPGSHS